MKAKQIDEYHYCSTKNNKKDLYLKNTYTDNELIRTRAIRDRLVEFIQIVFPEEKDYISLLKNKSIYEFTNRAPYTQIYYLEEYGYIGKGNYDRDQVDVYKYGDSEEEAFRNSIFDMLNESSHYYELYHREEINQDFSNRFKDGTVNEDDYHRTFVIGEHSLQLLRKYYGDNIPEEFIKEYEESIKESEEIDVKFNYETNRFEKNTNLKRLTRNRGE